MQSSSKESLSKSPKPAGLGTGKEFPSELKIKNPPAIFSVEPDFLEKIEDTLLEAGLLPTRTMLDGLEEIVDEEAWRRSGEFIRFTLSNLGQCAAGLALRRVVLGPERSLRGDARQVGVSPVALAKAEKVVRKRLKAFP